MQAGISFSDPRYDDTSWEMVSMPHSPNAADSFDGKIIDAGEADLYRGFFFYRKQVLLPSFADGHKIFLEFEAVRQTLYLYINGAFCGYYEAGVTACGFDITRFVKPGKENLIALATDNCASRHTGFRNKAHNAASIPVDASVTRETVPGSAPGDLSGAEYQ